MKLKKGDQVAYIPGHVEAGDTADKDVEFGFVMSLIKDGKAAFVRYFFNPLKHNGLSSLRTRANSEATWVCDLVLHNHRDQSEIDATIKQIEGDS